MDPSMARGAECDQIFFGVVARVAAKVFVVDLQVGHSSTRLTAPAIATQDLPSKSVVCCRIQPQAHGLLANRVHEAVLLKPSRNDARCSWGRNLKNLVIEKSSVSGSPLSRLAPARKSAQIISRQ